MTSQYFQTITPTTWFQPAKVKDIKHISTDEQLDGLEHLLWDVAGAYGHDDYYFYVYWTGFLYALSRSDIFELVWDMGTPQRLHTKNKIERLLIALILAYFLSFLYKYINLVQKRHQMIRIPFFDHLINTLLNRGYSHSKDKKQMVIDVLSEMVHSKHDSISEFEDLIKLVLEIMTNPLINIFGLIKIK